MANKLSLLCNHQLIAQLKPLESSIDSPAELVFCGWKKEPFEHCLALALPRDGKLQRRNPSLPFSLQSQRSFSITQEKQIIVKDLKKLELEHRRVRATTY